MTAVIFIGYDRAMTKTAEFMFNMIAYKPDVYGDWTYPQFDELASLLRMHIRLGVKPTVSTIVPISIVQEIWGHMLDPMDPAVLQSRLQEAS